MKTRSLLLAALTVLMLVQFAHAKDPFEGTSWAVKLMPDPEAANAGVKPFDDTLVFKGGKFTAEACKKHGFDATTYDDDTRPGLIGAFTATAKSDKEGTAKWTGTVTATEIKGELVWTKKDGTVLNYTYTGERNPK